MKFLLLFLPIFLLSISNITSETISETISEINKDYIADDPALESYFITYINDTKIITPLNNIKKLR